MSGSECYPEKAQRIDDLLDVLGHRHRREIVHYFENHTDEPTATLDSLVAHVAGRVPGGDREELRMTFAHAHLPKLRDHDWIDYDPRQELVRYYGHDGVARLLGEMRTVFAE